MRILQFLLAAAILCGLATAQGTNDQNKSSVPKEAPVLDLNALDRSVEPCNDFYQFACGGWRESNPIPPHHAARGRFNELAERNRAFLREILENASKATNRTPEEQKIGDYYAGCIDEDAINKKGIAVLKPEFDRIDAAKTKNDLTPLIAYLHSRGIGVLFGFGS